MKYLYKLCKRCTKCGVYKHLEAFHAHSQNVDGKHPRCKECRREDTANYRKANKEKLFAYEEGRREIKRLYAQNYRRLKKLNEKKNL